MDIIVGKKYRIFFNDDNPNNKTIRIKAIVDEFYVVYCWWGTYKRRWFYEVDHRSLFDLFAEEGHIKQIR